MLSEGTKMLMPFLYLRIIRSNDVDWVLLAQDNGLI
jgi:hypothetical protein